MGMTFTNFETEEQVREATEAHTTRGFYVGLDLGQSMDPTALSVIEKLTAPVLSIGHRAGKMRFTTLYRVRHLERFPLGLSYPEMVTRTRLTMNTAPLRGNSKLIIDQTGVGRPVFDLFTQARMNPAGVTITAGLDWSREGSDNFRVPKALLVSRLDAALHSGILQVSAGLPEAQALREELADFKINHTASGYAQFGARSGKHDDLVLSVAIGLWYAVTIGSQRMTQGYVRL